jgi:hypothetical protein
MAILNYSTTIKVEKTASEIQEKLAKAKAQAVLCEYDDKGIMCAMSFRIIASQGILSFRLPVNVDGVLKAMLHDKNVPKKLRNREQAARVAWRITKDWIEAQLAIVEAEMADIKEVFLPYVQDQTGQTLYKALESNGFKQLTSS